MTAEDISSPFLPEPVRRPRQQVEEQIRAAIRNGVVKTGQKLPTEVALSRDFGVSRTTVREALRSLVADGLIEKVPGAGGGSFVRVLDHHTFSAELGQDIQNLLQVGSIVYREAAEFRRMLEVLFAGPPRTALLTRPRSCVTSSTSRRSCRTTIPRCPNWMCVSTR